MNLPSPMDQGRYIKLKCIIITERYISPITETNQMGGELEQLLQEKPTNIDTSSNEMEDSDIQKSDACRVERPMEDELVESHSDSGLDTFDAQWTLTYLATMGPDHGHTSEMAR